MAQSIDPPLSLSAEASSAKRILPKPDLPAPGGKADKVRDSPANGGGVVITLSDSEGKSSSEAVGAQPQQEEKSPVFSYGVIVERNAYKRRGRFYRIVEDTRTKELFLLEEANRPREGYCDLAHTIKFTPSEEA